MFALVFRELIVVVAGLVIIWWTWTLVRKVGRRDARKEHAKELLDNIKEILELSKDVKVDPKKLQAAREKLEKLQKEGGKSG